MESKIEVVINHKFEVGDKITTDDINICTVTDIKFSRKGYPLYVVTDPRTSCSIEFPIEHGDSNYHKAIESYDPVPPPHKFKVGDTVRTDTLTRTIKGIVYKPNSVAEWWYQFEAPYDHSDASIRIIDNGSVLVPPAPKYNVGDTIEYTNRTLRGEQRTITEITSGDHAKYRFTHDMFGAVKWVDANSILVTKPAYKPRFRKGDTIKFAYKGGSAAERIITDVEMEPKSIYNGPFYRWLGGAFDIAEIIDTKTDVKLIAREGLKFKVGDKVQFQSGCIAKIIAIDGPLAYSPYTVEEVGGVQIKHCRLNTAELYTELKKDRLPFGCEFDEFIGKWYTWHYSMAIGHTPRYKIGDTFNYTISMCEVENRTVKAIEDDYYILEDGGKARIAWIDSNTELVEPELPSETHTVTFTIQQQYSNEIEVSTQRIAAHDWLAKHFNSSVKYKVIRTKEN